MGFYLGTGLAIGGSMTNTNKLTPSGRFALVANRRPFAPRLGRFGRPTWARAIPVVTERGEPLPIRSILRAVAGVL